MKQKIKEYWKKIKEKGFVIKLSLIPFACGLMYAIAGSNNTSKKIRRFGIPILLTLFSWLYLKNIWVLTMLTQIFVYHIGHGIPDSTDDGSVLGKFWYKLFKQNHTLADYGTRGTKALLIAISCLSIPILKESWIVYGTASTLLIGLIASLSWRGFGEKIIKIGNRTYTVLYVDIVTGSLIGLYTLLIVKF